MSSSSPPLTPPHDASDHEPTSPIQDPDVERELTPTEAVRERADGETSPTLMQPASYTDKESEKERAAKKRQDLDKDIDAVFEYNANGFNETSVSIGSIPVYSADSTLKDISIKTNSFTDRGELGLNGSAIHGGVEGQETKTHDAERLEGSEKSFSSISTSTSSVLAEAVVNRVLTNAIKLTKGDLNAKEPSGDVKVGLFQYHTDDTEVNFGKTDIEVMKMEGPTKETEAGDVKVGLFQYFDGGGVGQQDLDNQDQDLSGLDMDETDEKLESLNLSDQENILHLYGLGGPEVTETRVMATPPSSPITEDEKRQFFIDVQRDIYEPQKRMFSVQEKSSAESTPREKVTDEASLIADSQVGQKHDQEDSALTETVQEYMQRKASPVGTEEQTENMVHEAKTDSEIVASWTKEPQPVSIDVAPPLIHYESVKENGKFRIIKMPKEGNSNGVGTIKIMTESSNEHSPDQSPREKKLMDIRGQAVRDKGHSPVEVKGSSQKPEVKDEKTKTIDRKPAAEDRGITLGGSGKSEKETVDVIEDQLEQPLKSVSQTLPLVTPSFLAELEEKRTVPISDNEQVMRSYSGSREAYVSSGFPREPGLSRSGLVTGSPARGSRSQNDSRSHELLSEKQASLRRVDRDSRKQYPIPDSGSGIKTGHMPYSMEDYSRQSPARDCGYLGADSGRHPTPYEAELIQSAYNRVKDRTGEPSPKVIPSAIDMGPIPGYKTLQEQQARWAAMFKSLEDQHKIELRAQYERHQYNIHRLQQQMESELQKQHQSIRKKLDIHKEALRHMSPERGSFSSDRGYTTPDRGQRSPIQEHRSASSQKKSPRSPGRDENLLLGDRRSPERDKISSERMTRVRSLDMSRERRSRSADGSLDRKESKSWREIYQEVRAEEEKRDETPPPPVKRLEDEFADLENSTLTRSDLSPRIGVSPGRERILQGRERISPERDKISPEQEGHWERGWVKETPERSRVTGVERESRSRTKRSPQQHVPSLPLEEPERDSPLRPSSISPHVQELLDSLNEGRSSLRGLQSPPPLMNTSSKELPRAGVYSSPMPILTGKVSQSTQASKTTSASNCLDFSRSSSYYDRPLDSGRKSRETPIDRRLDDSSLSSSGRLNLREKHSKHLADLRSYYEEELRELRRALTESLLDTSGMSTDPGGHTAVENQLLEAENRHLLDKCRTMEDELEDLYQRIREQEQKGKGLEKRASEYAAAFADSQAMGAQNRAHIEELQRYCRERDDLVSDLEAKVRSQEDAMKIYKKNLEEELELHRQDKSALQRICDKYESLDREYKLLQETINSVENQLYDARTEVVELNRKISKLELENKRLGRENDNLRHKVTQSINLTSLHESFGNPPSPRQQDTSSRRQTTSPPHFTSLSADLRVPNFIGTPDARPTSADARVPGFTGTTLKSAGLSADRNSEDKAKKSKPSDKRQKESMTEVKNTKRTSKITDSREDLVERSRQQDREPSQERTLRDGTPPRSVSAASEIESETGDYSPLIKAERELYKLRDMMRQAVAVRPASSPPPEPVLQKKFYGSERPTSKDEYIPDFGTPRGRKERQPNSHTGVAKSKPNSAHSRQEKPEKDKSSKKSSASSKSDKSSKVKDKGKDKTKEIETKQRTPTKKDFDRSGISVKSDEFNSSTRFDINIDEDTKTLSVKKVGSQSGKQKNLFAESHQSTSEKSHDLHRSHDEGTQTSELDLQQTLGRLRAGEYTTRPQWENVFTSLAKPKPEDEHKVTAMTREEKIKEKLRNIGDMEHRYDELQMEKRQLESDLTKIPIHGRVDRNNRRQKEELEERLDVVEKELGSLRMSLKRCNVLKTAG